VCGGALVSVCAWTQGCERGTQAAIFVGRPSRRVCRVSTTGTVYPIPPIRVERMIRGHQHAVLGRALPTWSGGACVSVSVEAALRVRTVERASARLEALRPRSSRRCSPRKEPSWASRSSEVEEDQLTADCGAGGRTRNPEPSCPGGKRSRGRTVRGAGVWLA
jgi:hypothetical protein